MRQAIDSSSVGSAFYGHQQLQQQQHAGNLLHTHQQYHQQHVVSAVCDSFHSGCHGDRGDAIPQFEAGRRQMSSDVGVLGTSLRRSEQQRQPSTTFTTSRCVPELPDRACVDRYDYLLLGCDQFAKIS